MTPTPSLAAGARLKEIDLARGLVMILMALDHARDYFHRNAFAFDPLDPEKSFALLYATRWITHVCAPTFVFLAGVSAFLQSAKGKTGPALAGFLFTRGVWLIAIDATIVSFSWDFAIPWFVNLQVLWAIGVAMIVLSALVLLPRMAVLAIGLAIVAGHNLLDPLSAERLGFLWVVLHEGGPIFIGDRLVGAVFYPLLPWIGIMALGYGAGPLFLTPEPRRTRLLLGIGAAMLCAFLVLRGFNIYGNPTPWAQQATLGQDLMALLNVAKYPPSLLYVLATLGLMALALPLLARLKGLPAHVLATFGATPFFFYILHVYLIHAGAIVANAAAGQDPAAMFGWLTNAVTAPERLNGVGFDLWAVYVAWIAAVAALYPLCRWFAALKARRRDWWMSYL